jgi:rRNA maturation endonuclease Nob1
MAHAVIWVVDTSSVVEIRRSVETAKRPGVFDAMSALVAVGRLVFPKQVVDELERAADPKLPDAQYQWAKRHEEMAKSQAPSFEEVKEVLASVPEVLDPDKDSGVEEADPYVLAIAHRLRAEGKDARVVTQETKDTPRKMSLNSACGFLGLPSAPLSVFLRFEKIV